MSTVCSHRNISILWWAIVCAARDNEWFFSFDALVRCSYRYEVRCSFVFSVHTLVRCSYKYHVRWSDKPEQARSIVGSITTEFLTRIKSRRNWNENLMLDQHFLPEDFSPWRSFDEESLVVRFFQRTKTSTCFTNVLFYSVLC